VNKFFVIIAAFVSLASPTFAQLNVTMVVRKAPVILTLAQAGTYAISGQVTTANPITTGSTYKPSGAVDLYNGTTKVATGQLDQSGAVLFTLSAQNAGNNSLTAEYSGDANYLPAATSASLPVMIPTPDFSIAVDESALTVKQGETWAAKLSMTSLNGFTDVVNLSCGNLPSNLSCAFGASSLTGQSSPISTTVSVATVATTLATLSAIFLFGFGVRQKQRRRSRLAIACILSFVVLTMTGCGMSRRYVQTDGTPKGTYAIQVIGTSGSLVHTQQVNITVQ